MRLNILFIFSIIVENFSSSNEFAYYSTKTPYRFNPTKELANSLEDNEKCEKVHISAVYRHGSRAPSTKYVLKFNELQERLSKINDSFAKELAGFDFKFEGDKVLLDSGKLELIMLASRILENAPFTFTNNNTIFYSSSSLRSVESGRAFYDTLINGKRLSFDKFIKIDDRRMRFFDDCKLYEETVHNNPQVAEKYKEFIKSELFQKTFDEELKSMQILNLTKDEVSLLNKVCAHSIANSTMGAFKTLPAPCKLFDKRPVLKVIYDYHMALKQYWLKSYPYVINYKQASPLLRKILLQINEARDLHSKKSQNFKRGVFWFGHAETIIPLETLLGLFKPSVNLTADSYFDWIKLLDVEPTPSQLFRGSVVAPFAGNVAFVLYHCSEEKLGYQVELRVNEKPIEWMDNLAYAGLDSILTRYEDVFKDDFDEICHNSSKRFPLIETFVFILFTFLLNFAIFKI